MKHLASLTTPWLVAMGIAALPSATHAQSQAPSQPSAISVSARGEVQATPDRARVQVGVETQARTAAAASAENNRKQTAVLRALRALGIPDTQIRTLDYSVMPVQRWDEPTKRTVIDGYRVSNMVHVETDKIEQAGPIIDAALSNGANRVASLDFYLKDRARSEDDALAQAVASAKRQADVAARAAGGQLGELLELSINPSESPQPVPMLAMTRMSADAAPAPVSAGLSTIGVSVVTRWRFLPR